MKDEDRPASQDSAANYERLVFTLQAAGIGTWEFDSDKQQILCDDYCQQLIGFSGANTIGVDQLQTHLHFEDRERFRDAFPRALSRLAGGHSAIQVRTLSEPVRWLQFIGNVSFDGNGTVARCTGIVQDVTHQNKSQSRTISGPKHSDTILDRSLPVSGLSEETEVGRSQADEKEKELQRVFEQAPVVLSIMGPPPDYVYQMANTAYAEFIDRPLNDILGKPLLDVLPEIRGQGFEDILTRVMQTGVSYIAREAPFQVIRKGRNNALYLDFIYQPLYKDEQEITGVMGLVIDVTDSVLIRRKVEQSEARFRQLIEQIPVAMMLVKGPEFVFDTVNQAMLTMLKRGPEVIGLPALVAIPELMGQPIITILTRVYETGEPYTGWAVEIPLIRQGTLETGYFNLTYTPYYEGNQLTGIIQVATEVTEQVRTRKIIEASEARFRTLLQAAPVAIGLFVGRNLVIESPNQAFIDIVGKGNSIIGKPLHEAMPELDNQPFLQILDDVYTTGKPFHTFDTQVNVLHNGVLKAGFYDFSYTPILNENYQVYAILEIASDVTERVESRQKVAEAEAGLRGAIELAELGTWSIDPVIGTINYSDRLRSWFGYGDGDTITIKTALDSIDEKDRTRIQKAIAYAMTPRSGGIYDAEFMVVNKQTGQERLLHAQAKTFFTDAGTAYKMVGTARDITEQRKAQLQLEQQVQQRTQELLLANQDLVRSNDNLQQFAYIASHDLQEPLRKIQSFGDILKNQYSAQLEDGVNYLERMQSAATRMSGLIKDLLAFSRISIQQDVTDAVSLTDVVNTVMTDLELIIQETGALITVDALPIVQGDRSQLGQLFQNLLSNALKFRRANVAPVIKISTQLLPASALPRSNKPVRNADTYHCIDVTDNGIGFNEKYVDRIFQVFQRLHTKSEFTGTGIGLAICEKVVANHGGRITARSEPGQGATFRIYLPV